jgi:predicted esterase
MGGGGMGGAGLGGDAGMGGLGGDAGMGGLGGDAGMGGGGTGGTGVEDAAPSEGCGNGGRPSGGEVTMGGTRIYNFPDSYDGMSPMPLFVGFHAAGNPIGQIQNITNNTDIADNMVRIFGKSAGNEWNYNNDIASVIAMFDDVLANYCVDTNHVFASGHSSGAQMIVQILTRQQDAEHFNFKGVAPVAASNYGAIQVPTAVMYIQAQLDTVRNSSGQDVVMRFTDANGCSASSMQYDVAGCQSGQTAVDPGCIVYDGCTVPTTWCSHNDPQYSNTFHGVPCFATYAMYDFFMSL